MDFMVEGGAGTACEPWISFVQEADFEALGDDVTFSRSHSNALAEQQLEPKALLPNPALVQSKTPFAAEETSTSCM